MGRKSTLNVLSCLTYAATPFHHRILFPSQALRGHVRNVQVVHTCAISPSAYALFFSITINNGCGSILAIHATSTASFAPNQLSTLDKSGTPQSFNLGDLPCPPSSVILEPGKSFQPLFSWQNQWPDFADPSIVRDCKVMAGLDGWLDPPHALTLAIGGLGSPGKPGSPHHGRLRRVPAHAQATSWVPARTTMAA
ncbi:hypothetical protein HO173_013403 [Letharia columbiana]|uniref:Uncharacterized protein n=1 Tax=Letharia columbiana TaxID=112416 RepID=A0A8H6CFA5_9LECA|nr:uncharacterized protein HO173_013403 [Letharia columbiana]KAF6222495.1 hypothetical protein HO173_013403 [Letharia columbiana]